MWTDWKIDVAMVDSMGDPLHIVMHSMGLTWLWDGIQYVTPVEHVNLQITLVLETDSNMGCQVMIPIV